jgi:hypothetical protein
MEQLPLVTKLSTVLVTVIVLASADDGSASQAATIARPKYFFVIPMAGILTRLGSSNSEF